MKMKILSYKDTKLNIFTQPFYLDGERKEEEIIEIMRRMCANPQMPSVYFEYDLYCLGIFDDKTGTFEASSPEFLVSLGDFKHLRTVVQEVKEDVKVGA